MFNSLQRVGRDPEPVGETHGFAHQADIAQVWQKAAAQLVVRMAYIVTRHRVLSGQLANSSHETDLRKNKKAGL